jgi:hypothetical protein
MRKLVALSLCCLALAPLAVRADTEERTARNTLYVELAGNAGIYSLNYERFFFDDLSFRLGGSYMSVGDSAGSVSGSAAMMVIPATVSYLGLRSGNHALELGAGVTYVNFSASVSSASLDAFGSASGVVGTAIIGYRYAPMSGGINFRAALTPLFGNGTFLPWFGLAIGYGF